MKRHYVESSMAKSVGYDSLNFILEIEFRSGEIWRYHHVKQNVYEEMLSGSIGKYFQSHIKDQYEESRVK